MSEVITEKAPINITESAISQLYRIREEQNIPDHYALRIGVKGGGCSGFQYILGFDEIKDGDEQYMIKEDLRAVVKRAHSLYLLGMEIDWMEGLDNRGFIFNNPNATDTCGCGTSFSA